MGDKPYTMPQVKQDGPPPGGFAPIQTKRFVGVTTSIPSSVIIGLTVCSPCYLGFIAVQLLECVSILHD